MPGRRKSINTELRDAAVRHAALLQRYFGHEVATVLGFLEREVFPDLVSRIENGLGDVRLRGWQSIGDLVRRQRYQLLLERLDNVLKPGFGEMSTALIQRMRVLADTEADWQRGRVSSLIKELALHVASPESSTLRAIVTARPFQGRVLREWASGLEQSTRANLLSAIRIGIAHGEGVQEIVRRVRGTAARKYTDGVLATTSRNAEAVVRTVANHTASQARQAVFEENDDLVRGVQWVSTLDARTTLQCKALDGKVFGIEDGPRPPIHWNCRSTVTPVLGSIAEVGGDPMRVSLAFRASMNGQVPASTTYATWLHEQPAAFQDEVLGKTRAEVFRRGKVTLDRFVDHQFRPLTIKELLALEQRVAA